MKSSPASSLPRNPLLLPTLLVAIIVAVYYPAFFNDTHSVDDPGIFAKYSANPSLSTILLPGNGYYYRPLLELSFWLDNQLWGMEPSMMHLENILLHCANSLLVFLLARKISTSSNARLIAFFAALLFALHPVHVEAVAWIAGRTDPLLAMCILSSFYFWLRWLEKPRWIDMCGALLLFCAALLTKETALAFAVVVALFAAAWPGAATGRQRLTALVAVALPFVLLSITVFLLKWDGSALNRFVGGAEIKPLHAALDGLIALGFYVRKLVAPFPLNFAIDEVHPLHAVPALLLIPFLWLMFRRYRLSGTLFVAALLLLAPALLIAVKQISWTPFAERYLYLPTAFAALSLVGVCDMWHKKQPAIFIVSLLVLLCGFGFSDYKRTLLWGDKLLFFEDAVAKSPGFGSVYYSFGSFLMQKGDIDRATEAFVTADRLNKRDSMRNPIKASIMAVMVAKGNYVEARAYFFDLFKEKKAAPTDFLEILQKSDSKRFESVLLKDKAALADDLLETFALLDQRKPDPFWFYQSGKIALAVGNEGAAVDFFRKAYTSAPVDAHYKEAARTYFMRLDRRTTLQKKP